MKGLSLCGGGSKGAYELGAWEAFKELKMEFEVVTGTSIGSLNGAMYASDSFDRCAELWEKINIASIITNGFEIDEVSLKRIVTHQEFGTFLKDYVRGFTTDITPFKELMKEYLDPKKIKESKIKLGVIIATFPRATKESILIQDQDEELINDYLLASSSAFPVFPLCKINGKQYMDGGYADNLPINFCFDLGATHVVAVDLRNTCTHKEYVNHPCVDYIYPKWDLGSFLYFNPEMIARNRKLGYFDTLKYYGKYIGFRYTFNKTKKYDNASLELISNINNDFSYFVDKKLKNLFKRDNYVNIFSLLNEHIHRKVELSDYFIKCLESTAYIFNVDPSVVYNIKDFMTVIVKAINEVDSSELAIEYDKIKNDSKKKEFILECDKKLFAHLMFKKDFDTRLKYLLLQSSPELYLCYCCYTYIFKIREKKNG